MVTEAKAKKCWCPFARYALGYGEGSGNRWKQSAPPSEPHALNPVPCRCIASQCMAWRWDRSWDAKKQKAYDDKHGHCGLAGDTQ